MRLDSGASRRDPGEGTVESVGPDDAGDLRSTTEILHAVLDSAADGILVVDTTGRILTYNRRFADMWRLPDEILATRDDARALDAALRLLTDPEAFMAKVHQLYEEPSAESFDCLALTDGRTLERFSRPLRVGDDITGRVWCFRDVTAQRRSEERLRASEAYFRSLTEKSRDLIAIIGMDGIIRYASPSHQTVLGYPPEVLVGTDARGFIHPDDLPNLPRLLDIEPTRVIPSLEFRFRHHDGSWRTLETVGTNLADRPDIDGLVLNSRDVTARRRAELRTQTLLAIAGDITGHVDLEEILTRVQRRAMEALPADAIAVICEDAKLGRMRVMAHQGLPPDVAPMIAGLTFAKGELPSATRTEQGETVAVADFDLGTWLPPEGGRSAIGSLVLAPFDAWSRHFGILVAASFGPGRAFDDGQISLCTGIARQLALAMEATELYRAQAAEADVANALARFGRDLIAHVHEPAFLDRLCASTAAVLDCQVSATLLRRADAGVFTVIAGHGFSTSEAELASLVEVPLERMAGLLARLAKNDVTVLAEIPDAALSREDRERFGVTSALCMALRRGDEIVGVQVANRLDQRPFSPVELRIARDIAQTASLAISHAQLVEELEQANRVRAEFVATVSHELRTPLNIILGYGDLLLTDTFGELNEEQRSTLERMDRRARELLDLVNSPRAVRRLERGRVPIDVQPTALGELLAEVEAESRELQEKAAVPVVLELPHPDVELRTDRAKLKVVVKNLIGNALKFTDRGCVTMRAAVHAERVVIEVADTGVGIAPGDLAVVFQAFRQVKSNAARGHTGVGLGLFIVARFVALLRGSVSVQSTVGTGSTFRVELPIDYGEVAPQDDPSSDR